MTERPDLDAIEKPAELVAMAERFGDDIQLAKQLITVIAYARRLEAERERLINVCVALESEITLTDLDEVCDDTYSRFIPMELSRELADAEAGVEQ